MKIVCDSCSTKYSISDDKVRGKVFKIRCKKCSHIIVVRGTGEGAPAAAEIASAEAVWHLVVDGDQVGPLTDAEVRARLARGEITVENYLWKEGFSDWLRLAEVPEFADLAPVAPVSGEIFSDVAARAEAASGQQPMTDEAGAFFGSGAAGQEARASTKSSSGRTRAPSAAAAPEEDAFSAPASPALGGEGGDLFGIAAPVAHADSGRMKARGANGTGAAVARHDGGRVENLTAQRSENSVLFSLSNLQSLASPTAAPKSSSGSGSGAPSSQNSEGSGLIDIRAMAASTLRAPSAGGPSSFGGDSRAAMDELPSFGAFSSAAPVLLPLASSSGPPKWVYALVAAAAIMVVAVVWAALSILRKPVVVEQPTPAPIVAAAPPAAPAAAAAAAAGDKAADGTAAKTTLAEGDLPPRDKSEGASDKGGDKAGAKSSHRTKSKKGDKSDKGDKSGGDSKGASGDSGKGASTVASADDKPKPVKGSLDDLLEGALNGRNKGKSRGGDDDPTNRKSGGDSGGGNGPLAKSAVVGGMNSVKGKVSACYQQYKVPGLAMVNVVIGKSGKVSSASVTGKFAGTPTGACVEAAVKSASFPPSDGLTTPYPFTLR